MKKLFILPLVLIISMSSLFAWTNIIQLGLTSTTPELINETRTGNASYKMNGTGIDLGYIGIFDSKISLKANTRIGIGSASGTTFDNFSNPAIGPFNMNVTESIGVGYGFINTPQLYLGLFGIIGESVNCGVTAKEAAGTEYANLMVSSSFFLGGEVAAVYTPGQVFSLYASLSANVAFANGIEIEARKDKSSNTDPSADTRHFLGKPYFKVIPSIGIAWKF